MAKTYDKTNTLELWKNEKKNQRSPDYSGTVNIDGKEYKVAVWEKELRGGKIVLSGPVTPADAKRQEQPEQQHHEDPF